MRVSLQALTLLLLGLASCRDRPADEAPRATTPASALSVATPTVTPLPGERVTFEGKAMGTHVTLVAFTTDKVDGAATQRAFAAVMDEFRRLEALMTTWQPDSELSRVNDAAGRAPVVVSPETLDVLREAIVASERSNGAFDVTFETLHGLWKFDQDLDPHPPTESAVAEKLKLVGYKHVHLDEASRSVRIDTAGVRIGLGGIAKGYAVDRAVAILDRAGLTSFYVQAGGDLFTRGSKPAQGCRTGEAAPCAWSAGVRDPRGPEGSWFAVLPTSDHAFSTAGDYERSYIVGGKRYHHIIDPRTGAPATASRSVTIWAPTALLADGLDDAVFILGPEAGLRLVESIDGVGAVIVDAHNRLWVSRRLEGKLKLTAPPTDAL